MLVQIIFLPSIWFSCCQDNKSPCFQKRPMPGNIIILIPAKVLWGIKVVRKCECKLAIYTINVTALHLKMFQSS